MVDITAFPTIRNVLYSGDNIQSFLAGDTIKAGMVVCFHATGVAYGCIPCIAGAGTIPIGVALYDAASGAYVAVAMAGCVCYVAKTDITGAVVIDAGDYCIPDDNAVGGCVSPLVPGAVTQTSPLGIFLDKAAATAATARVLIHPMKLSAGA